MVEIILDLEATCEDREVNKKYNQEIIEIGAVKIKGNEIIDEFSIIVKPTNNPIITDFCFNLTGITQEDVNKGVPFEEAIILFDKWCKKDSRKYKLFAWGDFDRIQIYRDLKSNNIKGYKFKITNLKRMYARKRKLKKEVGLKKALNRENIVFEGEQHRALVDAKNTAKLYFEMNKD